MTLRLNHAKMQAFCRGVRLASHSRPVFLAYARNHPFLFSSVKLAQRHPRVREEPSFLELQLRSRRILSLISKWNTRVQSGTAMFIMNIRTRLFYIFRQGCARPTCHVFENLLYFYDNFIKTRHVIPSFSPHKTANGGYKGLFVKILENFTHLARNLL